MSVFFEAGVWRPLSDGVPGWLLEKLGVAPDKILVVEGNLLLNEGIQELLDLATVGTGGGAVLYSNANAEIGVGDSSTAAAATQTALQGTGGGTYKGMNGGYPIRTNQTMEWRADFLTAEANHIWNEWSIRNGNARNRNLNRKVENLGTKTTGTWTMAGSVTLS